uniref:Peptidase S1 domain-containing protein n=1 Tax=Timema cristinae TaxID=61476 RepID=A0A7R9DDS2_TIMCR|nr:unnamed protein product [Timema cristinae]
MLQSELNREQPETLGITLALIQAPKEHVTSGPGKDPEQSSSLGNPLAPEHRTSDHDQTPPLRAVKLDVFPTKDCQKIHQRLAVKRGKTVCTYSEGKDSCSFPHGGPDLQFENHCSNERHSLTKSRLWCEKKGDSGGPLVCGPDDIQEGVTSFGQECAGKLKPGVFVRVAGYLRWIKNTVTKDKRSLIQDEDYRSLATKYQGPQGAEAVLILALMIVL